MANEINLTSNAEMRAQHAESLRAFGQLNLLHIKRQVALMLGMIGREGIFDQYTVHDISHIDKMLDSLDWIIPEATKSVMSPADYLMTVLAIYFHDMGMLVTKSEYAARAASDFPRYRDEILFAGSQGQDYRAKVSTLARDDAERFLYQEFVRHKHAERVKNWVTGSIKLEVGKSTEIADEIDKLLEPLGEQFRRDLGLICESHHLDDLNDLRKYKPSQPYADSDEETANLQYCAVLLRTADLLHVTMDRTPSVSFKVINPTDPISQQEWAKQMAVKRVRAKTALDAEGQPDEKAIKDTIEIHAYFTKADGFFGLNSYLSYAEGQLKRSTEWVTATRKLGQARHEFNWRKIDDQNIETRGFLREAFEFTIDQAKILDLLTGHTLYNDTQVVLRELSQNAIDAIRLQNYHSSASEFGAVRINWDSKQRVLSVADNGTGMTQSIISNFLLKVGTSRYQDAAFKKQYPQFSSISRFGIGVLSAFMIADSVEILTCHPDEQEARQLILRSVHGKYLIQLLEKADARVADLAPHGTKFSLNVRPSIDMPDVLETAKLWLVVPGCSVTVQIDNEAPVQIGHKTVADALRARLSEHGIVADIAALATAPNLDRGDSQYRIVEREADGVALAFLAHWNEYFKEWTLTSTRRSREKPSLGICIEGIRVEFSTPGFTTVPIYALANVRGPKAPKTNVARSGLESTPERDSMLRTIYGFYKDHVAAEIAELTTRRSFSLTWATAEAKFIIAPLIGDHDGNARPVSPKLFQQALEQLDILLVEKAGKRAASSVAKIQQLPAFWTIDCALFHSAEPLIREAATATSLANVINSLGLPDFGFPEEEVLCGVGRNDPYFGENVFTSREVSDVVIHNDKRRIDLKWVPREDLNKWLYLPRWAIEEVKAFYSDRERSYAHEPSYEFRQLRELRVATERVRVAGTFGQVGVQAFGQTFVLPNTSTAKLLGKLMHPLFEGHSVAAAHVATFACQLVLHCIGYKNIEEAEKLTSRQLRHWEETSLGVSVELRRFAESSELIDLLKTTEWLLFSPSAWTRQGRFDFGE